MAVQEGGRASTTPSEDTPAWREGRTVQEQVVPRIDIHFLGHEAGGEQPQDI